MMFLIKILCFSDAISVPGSTSVRFDVVSQDVPLDIGFDGQTTVERRTCKFCRRVMASPSALRLHLRTHTGHKPYICAICSRAFAQKGTLRSHMLTHASVDNL